MDSRIENLVNYARNQGDADRTALFRNLIDLFLAQDAPTDTAFRNQLLTVLVALIPHVDEATRETAASLIAAMPTAPMDLVLKLVQDEAHLVKDLLHKIDFDEDDLIDLIEHTGRAHHQEIAARPNLSANVWIALARAAPNRSSHAGLSDTRLFEADLMEANAIEPQSATVTALHPDKLPGDDVSDNGGFRILRTGETLRDDSRHAQANNTTQATQSAPPLPAFLQEPKAGHVADPSPHGWGFRSNRDGFITHLSPTALRLFVDSSHALGDALLDFLGLNSKLGHPVARAFQRRSPIEEAPLYIDGCPKGARYWQLSAVPRFSSETGSFDGYDGRLAPVATDAAGSALDDAPISVPPQAQTPIDDFLSEEPSMAEAAASQQLQARAQQPEATPAPAPELDEPAPAIQHDSLSGSNSFDNFLDQIPTDMIGPEPRPAPVAAPASVSVEAPAAEPASKLATDTSAPTADSKVDISQMLMQQLQAAMHQMQAETKEAVQSEISRVMAAPSAPTPSAPTSGTPRAHSNQSHSATDEATKPVPEMIAPAEPAPALEAPTPEDMHIDANPADAPTGRETNAATLDMLTTAVDMFLEHAKESGNLSLRLQAEVALACVRTLRDSD